MYMHLSELKWTIKMCSVYYLSTFVPKDVTYKAAPVLWIPTRSNTDESGQQQTSWECDRKTRTNRSLFIMFIWHVETYSCFVLAAVISSLHFPQCGLPRLSHGPCGCGERCLSCAFCSWAATSAGAVSRSGPQGTAWDVTASRHVTSAGSFLLLTSCPSRPPWLHSRGRLWVWVPSAVWSNQCPLCVILAWLLRKRLAFYMWLHHLILWEQICFFSNIPGLRFSYFVLAELMSFSQILAVILEVLEFLSGCHEWLSCFT